MINKKLDVTRNCLINEIIPLSYTLFNARPAQNNWSIAQVCQHLVLVEQATIKAIAWGLKEANNTQVERKNVQQILDRTKKIKAPKIVEPDTEPFEVQSILDSLNESRTKLQAFLTTIDDQSILTKKSLKHPALGELPLDQWIEQIYLHEQRHLEQIKEIKIAMRGK